MAPCGCFFDPRIYRIEWATANFVQPSVYKLSNGLNPPNTYLLDSQKYHKTPMPPVPYPSYQAVANNPPFAMPFFKAEDSTTNLAENPLHGSPFGDVPHVPSEDLGQGKDQRLFVTVPGLSLKERNYEHLKGQMAQSNNCRTTCHTLTFQTWKSFQMEEGEPKGTETTQDFAENHPIPTVHSEEQTPTLNMLHVTITPKPESPMNYDNLMVNRKDLLEDAASANEEESFDLPEKVLLEDAMKLFDCSLVNSDTEASLDGLVDNIHPRNRGDGCFAGDLSGDIRSLNLPDELLSFDYSVPEILSAVTSLDYLYDVNSLGDEAQWVNRPPSQPLLKPESQNGTKKGKTVVAKPKLAALQGGDSTPEEPPAAVPKV